jgi:hypothetical protein
MTVTGALLRLCFGFFGFAPNVMRRHQTEFSHGADTCWDSAGRSQEGRLLARLRSVWCAAETSSPTLDLNRRHQLASASHSLTSLPRWARHYDHSLGLRGAQVYGLGRPLRQMRGLAQAPPLIRPRWGGDAFSHMGVKGCPAVVHPIGGGYSRSTCRRGINAHRAG